MTDQEQREKWEDEFESIVNEGDFYTQRSGGFGMSREISCDTCEYNDNLAKNAEKEVKKLQSELAQVKADYRHDVKLCDKTKAEMWAEFEKDIEKLKAELKAERENTREYWVTDNCLDEMERHVGCVMRGMAAMETPYLHKVVIKLQQKRRGEG